MEVKTDNTNEMTLLEHALIAARRERQAAEEAYNEVQRVYINAKKRMQDAQTRFEGLSNRRTEYLFDVRDALLPASLRAQPGWYKAEIVSAELSRFGSHLLTVKFRLPSGHHLTLNYIVYDGGSPAEQERGREQFLLLVDATSIDCNENSTLQDILQLMIGRQVMIDYRGDGGKTIPAITHIGHFWHAPPATGKLPRSGRHRQRRRCCQYPCTGTAL